LPAKIDSLTPPKNKSKTSDTARAPARPLRGEQPLDIQDGSKGELT